MTCATYGVAVTVVHRGRVKQNMLVLGPKLDHPHLVNSGDQDFADDLCKMRKARRSPVHVMTPATCRMNAQKRWRRSRVRRTARSVSRVRGALATHFSMQARLG